MVFDGHDLHVDYDEKLDEINYMYVKGQPREYQILLIGVFKNER